MIQSGTTTSATGKPYAGVSAWPRNACYLACVARFHPVKDHATLLRAFAAVAAARDNVDLLLVGDGPLRGELERLTRQLGIQSRVRFLGVRSDVPDLLRAVDLFTLTSVSEAASLTLLEAMASFLPVVVTAVGGNPEIVRHEKEGLLVPRADAPATAAALLRLLGDPVTAGRHGGCWPRTRRGTLPLVTHDRPLPGPLPPPWSPRSGFSRISFIQRTSTVTMPVPALTSNHQGAAPNAARKRPFRQIVREGLKALLRAVALVLITPMLLSFWIRAVLMGRDRAVAGSSQLLSLVPGLLGQYLRRAFFSQVLAACHHSATIEFGVLFSQAGACIGENVYIGPRCSIGLVAIEREVLLGAGVHVTSGAHTHGFEDLSTPLREQPGVLTQVRIGAGAWVGSAAVVMANVGRDTIVGAGAVVTKPLPDRVIAAGVPARILRNRQEERGVDQARE